MNPRINNLELLRLASGDSLSIQIYKFVGRQSSKKVYIQSNLHGSEIVGNAVIYQLIEFFGTLDERQLLEEVWLVPVCNPFAINQRNHFFSTGRFNSYDGADWNRIFWDYEKECNELENFAQASLKLDTQQIIKNFLEKQKAAFAKQLEQIQKPSSASYREQYRYLLQSLFIDANYVIDLHSSSNLGIDYLYCFPGREKSAKYFCLDYGIWMDEYEGKSLDEAFMKPWLALEKKLTQLGRPIQFEIESWTLELGAGMQMNPASVKKGVKGIKNYLNYKKILDLGDRELEDPIDNKIKLIKKQQIKNYYAPTGGMIQNRVPLNSSVKAGERLYQILSFNKNQAMPTIIDIYSETAGLVFDLAINHSVNQGEYVLGILMNTGDRRQETGARRL